MKIWKYELKHGKNEIEIENVKNVEVLSVANVGNELVGYVKIDDVNKSIRTKCKLVFTVVFTGEEFTLPYDSIFIGTVNINGLVYHVYYATY